MERSIATTENTFDDARAQSQTAREQSRAVQQQIEDLQQTLQASSARGIAATRIANESKIPIQRMTTEKNDLEARLESKIQQQQRQFDAKGKVSKRMYQQQLPQLKLQQEALEQKGKQQERERQMKKLQEIRLQGITDQQKKKEEIRQRMERADTQRRMTAQIEKKSQNSIAEEI